MRSRILVGLIAGAVGGFLGWLLQERLIDYNALVVPGVLPGQRVVTVSMSAELARAFVLCVGGLIGLFLGVIEGVVEGNSRKLIRGMALGAVTGVLLGYIGFAVGNAVYNALGGHSSGQMPDPFSFARQVIARSLGWAMLGLGLGIGAALPTRSAPRIRNGAIGGFLGGLVGGFVFDMLAIGAAPVQEIAGATGPRDIGGQSRLVGITAIGAATGFFIGLVEELLKQAWLKVLAGRNEGKDYILSNARTLLGRDERCDVPLFGDASVGAQHAAILAAKNRHTLVDAGTPAGTLVNGQRVPPGGETLLRDGDMIQIGTHRILFREKATANKFAQTPIDAPKAASPASAVPMPSHLCPFCGAPKNAMGGCLCTVANGVGLPASGGPAGGYAPPVQPVTPSSSGLPGGYGAAPSGGIYAGSSPALGGAGSVQRGVPVMPRLVGLEGPYHEQVFLLTESNVTIGRDPNQNIVLTADPTISRQHARIANENGDFVIYDNGSSNGTFVNTLRVTMQVLNPGDMVQFGSTKFRFE